MISEATAISFLIEIGRWAKSELSERWKLRHKQMEIDLSDKEKVEADMPTLLQATTMTRSEGEIARTWSLIERRREAINRARNAKLADQEEFDRKELPQSAFEERLKKHTEVIKQMLDENKSDLESLGFTVKRESV